MIEALLKEIELNANIEEAINTIYFGGGTPGLCSVTELESILKAIYKKYAVSKNAEITLEANPENLSITNLQQWKYIGINRLSIGIQSFYEEDLQWMNRSHTAQQAIDGLTLALHIFPNITIDLIYGSPTLTNEHWEQNVLKVIELGVPHISCYALTVEPHTPLFKLIDKGLKSPVDIDKQAMHFTQLMNWMRHAGYEHYEISNFSKPGFRSRHNTSYWHGESYIGLGPSAHSYNEHARWWNVSNNIQYINSIKQNLLPIEKEILTPVQKKNEQIMLSLRLMEGLDLIHFSQAEREILIKKMEPYFNTAKAVLEHNHIKLTDEGKLLADGIAAHLFFDEV